MILNNGDRYAYLIALKLSYDETTAENRRAVLKDLINKLETAQKVEFHLKGEGNDTLLALRQAATELEEVAPIIRGAGFPALADIYRRAAKTARKAAK